MVKGHNKKDENPITKGKGQDEHLPKKKREKASEEKKGRHGEKGKGKGQG